MDRIAAGLMTASQPVVSNGDIVRTAPQGDRPRPQLSHGQAVQVPRFAPTAVEEVSGTRALRVAGLIVALSALCPRD